MERITETSMPDRRADHLFSVELLQRRWLTENTLEIQLTRPPSWEFKPGQTICFNYKNLHRHYSLISAPRDSHLELCVFFSDRGRFSPVLAEARIGTHFDISGPHGYFTFRPSERQPVFIATGTGIAPFVSMVRSGVTGFYLIHEAENSDEFHYETLFREAAADYIPCLVGPPAGHALPPGMIGGRAADAVKEKLPPASYDFYLCGNGAVVRDVILMADELFSGSYVFKEVYFK